MIPVIGAILGLAGSIFPEILKIYKDKQDKKYEMEILKLQMEAQARGHQQRLEEIVIEGELKDSESARQFAPVYKPESTGRWWYDLLMVLTYVYNSAVRPTITYMMVGLYMLVKYAQIKMIQRTGVDFLQALATIWNENDTMLVFLVLTFWFGGRQILRSMGRIK
jgi:hypothetical protein